MRNRSREIPRRQFIRVAGASVVAVASGGSVLLTACDRSTGVDDEGNEDSSFVMMLNPKDPLLLVATTDTSERVEYYGTRDVSGVPTRVDQVAVTTQDGTQRFLLGSDQQPHYIDAFNGVQFQLQWLGAGSAAVTAVSPSGAYQVNTHVDFSRPGMRKARAVGGIGPAVDRTDAPVSSTYAPRNRAPSLQGTSSASDLVVQVLRCGALDAGHANVSVIVTDSGGQFLLAVPGFPVGAGVYHATLPSSIAPSVNPQELCLLLEGVLGVTCLAYDSLGPQGALALCDALAIALDAITIPSGEAALFVAACHAVVPAWGLYCSTLNHSHANSPSLAELLCRAVVEDRALPSDLIVHAEVTALPSNVKSQKIALPFTGPQPSLNVDLGGAPAIRALTLAPPNPSAGTGYVATGELFCAQPGSEVTMTIVGTDGYTNQVKYTVAAGDPSGTYQLAVPGAQAGVQDQVTLTVRLPNSQVLARTASLVFA